MIADRWGVTDAEVASRFPCDEVVVAPVLEAWRGVTVHAAPEVVWPWVAQIQLAPYSYDWVDNLGRRSPRTLQGRPDPVVGEPFTRAFGRPAGRVVSVEPGVQLTGEILGTVMSYLLRPAGAETRLLLKLVSNGGRIFGPLLCAGDLVMARRQLLNLARLAERSA